MADLWMDGGWMDKTSTISILNQSNLMHGHTFSNSTAVIVAVHFSMAAAGLGSASVVAIDDAAVVDKRPMTTAMAPTTSSGVVPGKRAATLLSCEVCSNQAKRQPTLHMSEAAEPPPSDDLLDSALDGPLDDRLKVTTSGALKHDPLSMPMIPHCAVDWPVPPKC